MPRHVKRVTLGHVPLDLVCDVVKLFEHVEDLRCVDIKGPQQVRLPNTVHVTSYLRNLADLPRRFSANFRAAKCGCP